jgi:hypothetical protein
MAHQTQALAAIARELARIRRPHTRAMHPGYLAIVAQADELGLPQRYATDITIHDRLLLAQRRPNAFAWLLHESGSLLSMPEPNTRPLDYLHAVRRIYPHALPFWWDGALLIRAKAIEELIIRMAAACAELQKKAEELL